MRHDDRDTVAHERGDLSNLTFVNGGGLAVRRNDPIKAPGDLAGKRIAVVAGSTAQARIAEGLRERLLQAEVVSFANAQKALDVLRRGDFAAFGHDRLLLAGLISRAPDAEALSFRDELISIEPYASILSRGDGALRLAVNRGPGADLSRPPDPRDLPALLQTVGRSAAATSGRMGAQRLAGVI